MGYQFVEVVTSVGHWEGDVFVVDGMSLAKGEQWRKRIVLNAELLVLDDELLRRITADHGHRPQHNSRKVIYDSQARKEMGGLFGSPAGVGNGISKGGRSLKRESSVERGVCF